MTLKFTEAKFSLNGFTLVLPSISVGNIGQLAVDILLYNTKSKKICDFQHDALIPVVGSEADHSGITTAGEVFLVEEEKYVIFQIRSAIIKFKEEAFIDSLLAWSASVGISSTIVLSSIAATERIDSQLTGTQFRYLSNQSGNYFEKFEWIELERRTAFPALAPGQVPGLHEEIFLPGSGFAKTFYKKCLEANFKFTILFLFASEGDNRQDSRLLAHHFNELANLFQPPARTPPIWKDSFENRAPDLIY